jgi:uncharacterized protein
MWNDLLFLTDHRPWQPPQRPWLIRMRWRHVLFAHWPIPTEVLRPWVPPGLTIEEYGGVSWVGIVPFNTLEFSGRHLPNIPGIATFPELNLRTYVTDGTKPGVWFFSLDAANPLIVAGARLLFHLAYYRALIHLHAVGDEVEFNSMRRDRNNPQALAHLRYRPTGDVYRAPRGSLDEWLTERYCLYSADRSGRLYRLEIHHGPWPLQPAEAEFSENTLAEAAGIPLPITAPLLHYARRLDVLAWKPVRLL